MADDRLNVAVETVARRAISNALSEYGRAPEWEDYPEIGEHDWILVDEEIDRRRQRQDVTAEEFAAAYEYLEGRAEK